MLDCEVPVGNGLMQPHCQPCPSPDTNHERAAFTTLADKAARASRQEEVTPQAAQPEPCFTTASNKAGKLRDD